MVIGVILALAPGLLFSAGNIAQKRAVDRLPKFSGRTPIATLRQLVGSWVWILGALLSIVGVLVSLAAFRKTTIAVVASLSAFGIIALVVIARIIFREHLARNEIIGGGFALAALGLVLASMGNSSGVEHGHLMTARTEVAILATIGVVFGLFALIHQLKRSTAALYGFGAGLLYGAMSLGIKGASAAIASFSSHNLLTGASRLLGGPIPYSVAFSWACALLLFQIGIQRTRLSIVAPLSSVVSTVYVIVVGTSLFGETWPHSPGLLTLRILGLIAILLALVFVLAPDREAREARSDRGDQANSQKESPDRGDELSESNQFSTTPTRR